MKKIFITLGLSLLCAFVLGMNLSNEVNGNEESETSFTVEQNIPNPANETTTINYSINSNAFVTCKVTDLTGKNILFFLEGEKQAGKHFVNINTGNLSPGAYFYTLRVNGKSATRKMMVE